jgi:hypothetical protein
MLNGQEINTSARSDVNPTADTDASKQNRLKRTLDDLDGIFILNFMNLFQYF